MVRALGFENQLGPGRAADISTDVEFSRIVVGASARTPLRGFLIKTRATEMGVGPVVMQIAVMLRLNGRALERKRLPNTPCVVKRASIYVTAAL